MAKGWKEVKGGMQRDSFRLEDVIDIYDLPEKEWVEVRPVGEVSSYVLHWIPIKTKTGKKVSVPKYCLAYDPETEEYTKGECPYCKLGIGRAQKVYLANFIIRELQENKPKKAKPPSKEEMKRGYRIAGDKSWSPVRVIKVPVSLALKIKEVSELNKWKTKKGVKVFDVSHPKYGRNLLLMKDTDKPGTDMYNVQLGEKAPLTKEEQKYLLYKLDGIIETEDYEDAIEEAKRLVEVLADKEQKKGALKKLKKLGLFLEDEEEPEDEEEIDNEELEEEEGEEYEDEEEIDEEEEYDDEEEEDEEIDEDEDEEEDEDIEDDEIDEDEDLDLDEDEDFDLEEDEEEEEEKPKKKKKAKKSKKKK